MQFLSHDWFAALDTAARARVPPTDDPLADVTMTIEQVVTDGPTWRMRFDLGSLTVDPTAGAEDDTDTLRLTSDRATATAIACGDRAALDAFMTGDLVVGGNVALMLQHREALETVGDLFASVRAATTF